VSASIWRSLEEFPTGSGTAAEWQRYVGAAWPAWQRGFLEQLSKPAAAVYCPRECGCAHRVVHHDDGRIVAVCECDPWNCDNIKLTAAEVVEWEFNRSRLARAVGRAFELERREQDLGLPWTQQLATFAATAVPVVLTIQQEPQEFRQVVAELASRWHDGFILFTPTSRFVDGRVHELLSHARAKFFDLESHVTLLPDGTLHAPKRAGELFASFVTKQDAAVGENEARSAFALLQKLELDAPLKAPSVLTVFQLYCVEGHSADRVALKCRCSKGTVMSRLRFIEERTGMKPEEFRAMSGHLQQVDDDLNASGAREIYRLGLVEGE